VYRFTTKDIAILWVPRGKQKKWNTNFSEIFTISYITTTTMSTTPTTEEVWPQQQHPTPVKSRIQGAVDYCVASGIKGQKEAIFRFNNVSHTTGYRILASNARTLKNDKILQETRGRKRLISSDKLQEMEKILQTEEFEARALTWE
jgi:hypothetical protein